MLLKFKQTTNLNPFNIMVAVILWLLSSQAMAANKIDTQNPYLMIKEVATQTFERFDKDKDILNHNRNYLKTIVAQQLMPYIDYKYAALKAMGRYVRDATPDQRQRFVNAFEGYLVSTYAQAFTAYTNQQVEFEPPQSYEGQKQVLVDVKIVEPGRPPINIGFKIRRLKNGTWKAFDMVAEGVSLLRSKQAEMDTLIRQEGLDKVIKMLDEKANDSIADKSQASRR